MRSRAKLLVTLAIAIGLMAVITAVIAAMLVDVIPPAAMTRTSMTETFVRIHLFAKASGKLPASLSDLPKRTGYANRTTDGWNRPLTYELKANGDITLRSLGKDGKPGGQGDDADIAWTFHGRRSDGTIWATDEMWIVEAEAR
jgi:general secretion pathway protein G